MNKSTLINGMTNDYITVMSQRFHTDRDSLIELIERVPTRNLMVEVGSLAGFSTRIFSLYFDKVISVDPYIPNYDKDDINANHERLMIAKDIFTIRFFDDPKVKQIRKKSTEASTEFGLNSIDFIYLDAGHDYKSVRDDIQAWLPKLKTSAFIAGDDYDWPGVRQAVEDLLPEHEVISGRWIAKI